MNQSFRQAGDQYRQKLPVLSQNAEVVKLYRDGLRCLQSWTVSRHIFIEEADLLRAQFEANKQANPAQCKLLVRDGNVKLFEHTHPDIYKVCEMPGGSKFMRNPPPPLSVCFPDGHYPVDAPTRTLNPDLSTSVIGGGVSGSGQVIVDFTRKNMT